MNIVKTSTVLRERIGRLGPSGAQLSNSELMELDQEIDHVLSDIGASVGVDDAKSSLDELAELQHLLATLSFKYHVLLSSKQRAMVRACDRLDDAGERVRAFRAAKEGRFP